MKKALFAGSFDPFTTGHADIVERACALFDKVVIAIGYNYMKPGLWPIDKRLEAIKNLYHDNDRVEVVSYTGLTVDFALHSGCSALLRGVRDATDFSFEQRLADTNRAIAGLETVLLISKPELAFVSSSLVRELIANGADASKYIAWNQTFNNLSE